MAHIQPKTGVPKNGKYQVRWRTPEGKHRTKVFTRRADAERFKAEVTTDIARGTYVDPTKLLLETVAEKWFRAQRDIRPSTRASYRTILDVHILPALGSRPIARLAYDDIQAFISDLDAAPGTTRNIYFTLKAMLDFAVLSRRIPYNPALQIKLPPVEHEEQRYLDPAQIDALANAMKDPYAELVRFAAYTGLRAGEIVALRVRSLDFLRRLVHVTESVTFVERVGHVRGPTKNRQTRTVPMSPTIAAMMETYVAGKSPDASVFTARSGALLKHQTLYRSDYKPAAFRAGLFVEEDEETGKLVSRLRFHDLRHTCASLLIAAKASPKEVCDFLGHSTITITMDRYGHLFPEALTELASRLDLLAPAPSNVIQLSSGG